MATFINDKCKGLRKQTDEQIKGAANETFGPTNLEELFKKLTTCTCGTYIELFCAKQSISGNCKPGEDTGTENCPLSKIGVAQENV